MDRLKAQQCERCGNTSEPCEVHHVRHLKDRQGTPLWQQVKAARLRKRIVLCHTCPAQTHAQSQRTTRNTQVRRAG
ncbi:hypothetical protein [Nitrosococcus wardiae]|uniref:HNH endonuclease n=1 Tax=Nitrosococcus wardiae TaxID=1814290 RepID=UPI003B8364C4